MDFTTFYKTANDYLARNLPEGLSVEMMGKYFEYSCAVKPPFRNAGYRRSGNGVPQLLLAN